MNMGRQAASVPDKSRIALSQIVRGKAIATRHRSAAARQENGDRIEWPCARQE